MTTELAKQYDPQEAQTRWLQFWDDQGFFHSRPDAARDPFTIVIPPPNVTGALHLGHALNNTLQDILIRWRRMQGYNTLWIPGTDHAGIATQAVVERRLKAEEKKTRHDVGREELIRRIWEWKEKYGGRIQDQLKQLGCSCDWDRMRFTLDDTCVAAVRHTFFRMFKDGLIFRGKRLVNWDTELQTSVANDETYDETIKGGFWTFRYPLKEGEGTIEFSTTRPETMLGDTAVAVHPDDPRYKDLIGKLVTIPLMKRDIPIIADGKLAKMEKGTGAVKVTPAHDPNDYECGLRNDLEMINILNADGTINENGGDYAGMDRFKAREKVVEDMEALGFFVGREDRDIDLKHSDRSKSPIEPYLSDQWFVKMEDLAQSALDAVNDGRVTFFPDRYKQTYLNWLGEKRDWCISRQLWWGHRIPIWYVQCPEAELKKAFGDREDVTWTLDEENAQWLICALEDIPEDALGEKYPLKQDPDVLDTWFSSALWPHSTLGWPEKTKELEYYYPTSVLVTNRDIITLWVARMVITGLYNVGEIPFPHVHIHSTIMDGFGERMSKTKGNGVDPIDVIELYGADALRYGMARLATESQDNRLPVENVCPHCQEPHAMKREHMNLRTKKIKCTKCKKEFRPGGPWPDDDSERPTAKQGSKRFEEGRNFANKMWNAARFLLMNLEGYKPEALQVSELPLEDRWILSRLATTTQTVTEHLENYRFSNVTQAIYDFTWSEFCDWYVEMSKDRLKDDAQRATAQRVLAGVLDGIIRLVHPVMPFVAESLWDALNDTAFERGLPAPEPAMNSVVIAAWPEYPKEWQDAAMEQRISRMQALIRATREIRNRYQVGPKEPMEIHVRCEANIADDFAALEPFIKTLAGVGAWQCGADVSKPKQSASHVHSDFELFVSLAGLIDIDAEVSRLEQQRESLEKVLANSRSRLENENFVSKAPPEKVQEARDRVADLEKQIEAIDENLSSLRSQ